MPINTPEDIQRKITRARAEYPALWRRIIDDWHVDANGDTAWLTYAANYLFRTGGVRWAIDPFSLSTRIKDVGEPDFESDLGKLELVLLTHAHNDHLDLNLIHAIASLPIRWVVPRFMLEKVLSVGVPQANIIVPANNQPISYKHLTITPFAAQHIRGNSGVPETGYLVACGAKRWIFPGDTRVYDPANIIPFAPVDAVFAHVWLGKACAAMDIPPLVEEFCHYFTACRPHRIILTHLDELGRDEKELWDERHVILIKAALAKQPFTGQIESGDCGGRISL
jgi:L-ascorbate metabolism protein UlaG (beta-lactamase superfamily)